MRVFELPMRDGNKRSEVEKALREKFLNFL